TGTEDFSNILVREATQGCHNLTITKQIRDASGALVTPTPADANGWHFTNTITGGPANTIDPTATTAQVDGMNGVAEVMTTITSGTATITVNETVNPDYFFVSAQCFVSGSMVSTTPVGTSGVSFSAPAFAPLACTFTNQRQGMPTVTVTPVPTNATVGTAIHATAALTGAHPPFTSTATLHLYSGTTCTGPPVNSSTNSVSGTSATSNNFTPTAAGTYSWQAVYNGDPNNATATSGCAQVTLTTA